MSVAIVAMDAGTADKANLQRRLKIGKAIGSGAYAIVYRATLDGRPVALKVLLPHHTATGRDDCPVMMFRKEGELLQRLDHCHVVSCAAVLELPPDFPGLGRGYLRATWALALELLEDGSLSSLMHKQLRQPWNFLYDNAAALAWSSQVASALAYMHGCSPPIIHRDVKLENVILHKAPGSKELVVKMIDLGLHTRPLTRERCTRQTLLRASMQPSGGSYTRRNTMPDALLRTDPAAAPTPSFASISQPQGRAPSSARGSRLASGQQGGDGARPSSALFLALLEGSNAPYAVDVNNRNMNEPLKPLAWSPAVVLLQAGSPGGSGNGMLPAADAAGGAGAAAAAPPPDIWRLSETGEDEAAAARSRRLQPFHSGGSAGGGGGGGERVASDTGSCGTASTPGGTTTGTIAASTATMSGRGSTVGPADREAEAAAEAAARWCYKPRSPGCPVLAPASLVSLPPLTAAGRMGLRAGASAASLVSAPSGGDGGLERARPSQHNLYASPSRRYPFAAAAAGDTASAHGTSPLAIPGSGARRPHTAGGLGSAAAPSTAPAGAGGHHRPARTPSVASLLIRQQRSALAERTSDHGASEQPLSGDRSGAQRPLSGGGMLLVRQPSCASRLSCTSRPATAQDIQLTSPGEGGGGVVAAEVVYRLTGETGSAMSMAPEVRLAQPYNEKIDVYAFGIFLFELWSRSPLVVSHIGTRRPDMPKMLHQCDDWPDLIAAGYRPQRANCIPDLVWLLIEDCWHADPLQRPSMQEALERLEHMGEQEQAEAVIGLSSGKGGKKLEPARAAGAEGVAAAPERGAAPTCGCVIS